MLAGNQGASGTLPDSPRNLVPEQPLRHSRLTLQAVGTALTTLEAHQAPAHIGHKKKEPIQLLDSLHDMGQCLGSGGLGGGGGVLAAPGC